MDLPQVMGIMHSLFPYINNNKAMHVWSRNPFMLMQLSLSNKNLTSHKKTHPLYIKENARWTPKLFDCRYWLSIAPMHASPIVHKQIGLYH
jgi:hypothetical protein